MSFGNPSLPDKEAVEAMKRGGEKRCMAQKFCKAGETGCKFWATDMDLDPFCTHPEALELSSGFGLSLNAMRRHSLCSGDAELPLHEPDTRK